MDSLISRFTILFDDPYWIGVYELEAEGKLYVCKHIFGAEPSSEEVYEFVLRQGSALLARLTSGVDLDEEKSPQRVVNFKRMQRETRRTIAEIGISSKAHEAIRLKLEEHKHQRQEHSRDQQRSILLLTHFSGFTKCCSRRFQPQVY